MKDNARFDGFRDTRRLCAEARRPFATNPQIAEKCNRRLSELLVTASSYGEMRSQRPAIKTPATNPAVPASIPYADMQ